MNRPTQPAATFVVERQPGKGYTVTVADGPRAGDWAPRALALLDDLGQPDPHGPEVVNRLVGPLTPGGDYVSVVIRRTPTGEARYEQVWFTPVATTRPAAPLRAPVLALLVGCLIGGVAVYFARPAAKAHPPTGPAQAAIPQSPGPPTPVKLDPPAPAPDPQVTRLRDRLAESRGVRRKLTDFLSQERLSAGASDVVEPKRSVRVDSIAEQDPGTPRIDLTNVEVATVVELLRALDEFTPAPRGP